MAAVATQAPSTNATPAALAPPVPFPATWKASLAHWWSTSTASVYAAQKALLVRGLQGTGIPVVDYNEQLSQETSAVTSTNTDGKVARLRKVELGGDKNRSLNILEVGTPEKKPGEHTFLVLHGYGGAFAFYWQNMPALCSFPNTRIYFMDMLGMGLSGRPKFPTVRVKGDAADPANVKSRVEQAEKFFLDSFEDFAKKEKLDRFTMIGHSMGGYLSTAYALKYPQRVNKLVLVSPVGVPKSPYASDEEEEKSPAAQANVDREFQEDQLDTTQRSSGTEYKPKDQLKAPPNGWWVRLWEMNVSPFSIVRFSSFAGPKLVSRYAERRFALFEPNVQSELFDYLYGIYGLKGSGEYCLAHLLSPGAYARWPLITRLANLDPKIPVSFVYGENDWMDKNGGEAAAAALKNRQAASDLQKRRTKVVTNPHAGHWVFLDNPGGMDKIFRRELQEAIQDH